MTDLPREPEVDEEIPEGTIVLGSRQFDALSEGPTRLVLPFRDYATVVAVDRPDARDRYGLVAALHAGQEVTIVCGVGKHRRTRSARIQTVRKALAAVPGPRMMRLRLVLTLELLP